MPRFERAVPILSVADVDASISYYMEWLGFEHCWSWGEPTGFGGVTQGDVEIFFCRNCRGGPGTWVSVWVDASMTCTGRSRPVELKSASRRRTSIGVSEK